MLIVLRVFITNLVFIKAIFNVCCVTALRFVVFISNLYVIFKIKKPSIFQSVYNSTTYPLWWFPLGCLWFLVPPAHRETRLNTYFSGYFGKWYLIYYRGYARIFLRGVPPQIE